MIGCIERRHGTCDTCHATHGEGCRSVGTRRSGQLLGYDHPGRPMPPQRPRSRPRTKVIDRMLTDGARVFQILAATGCDTDTVYRRMDALGLDKAGG